MKDKKILIVEDSKFQAKTIANILNKYGYTVEIALTGEAAVEKVSGGWYPDLTLMDIELGEGMDGVQTAQAIQQISELPVVFLTAHTEPAVVKKIRSVTAYGYVMKSATEQVLITIVEMALRLYEANVHANMYWQILEHSLNEIYIFNPETLRFHVVNRGARKNLGYTLEELNTMTPLDLKPEFDLKSFRALLEPLLSGKEEQIVFYTVHRRKDGSLYPVEVHLQLFDYRGEKLCLALVIDLTERKALEEENRRKEEQLRLMLEALPNPTYLINRERQIIALNQVAKERGAVVGDYCWHSIHHLKTISPVERQFFENTGKPLPGTKCYFCRADEALNRKQKENCEVNLDGLFWNIWWVPIDENTYLHYIIDVTKYKKMEEEIREQEEFLRLILDSMPAGVMVVDAKTHRIENVNLEAAAMIGASPEEIIGKSCFEIFPESKGLCPITAVGQEMDWAERILHRVDGSQLPVLKIVKRLKIKSGEKLIETFIDLTERKKLEEQLYRLSITDYLTQAYNRRYFTEMLEREIERAKRTKMPFALIMLDIDHFKNVNDRFGHAAGDLVLKSLVNLIKNRIRQTDCLARWGGEEFVILLPDTPVEKAAGLAEELREQLSMLEIPGVGRVTASFGVTGYCPGDTLDTLLMRADQMLYAAKASGRNCVRFSEKCPES
ncbi:REC domain-containing diguanylate cyclase [Carboxydothermus islandicus]|uniref:Stage 0 sporulation protein A homolog n=1 Tax=Carboxydothermus islandicus TaxID=661089 RepID=A0A1L8D040_9THEO|nr:diguanylate cyclase [Carboxydothermus islandicus]GAV24566.1 REC domain-containing diguanylate cyclase [Carboxydothermus islandicus]